MADPNLASDTCIYLEANSGDNGIHNLAGTWWMSPDIDLADTNNNPINEATAGAQHLVRVRVRKHPGACSFGTGASANPFVKVEAFVAIPSATMDFSNVNQVKLIGTQQVRASDIDANGVTTSPGGFVTFNWTPSNVPNNPDGPGHKCLIGRGYPRNLTPTATLTGYGDDPHIVQHNLVIKEAPSGAPLAPLMFGVANPDPEVFVKTTVLAEPVLKLDPVFEKRILQLNPGIEQFATFGREEIKALRAIPDDVVLEQKVREVVPRSFKLQALEFPNARILDRTAFTPAIRQMRNFFKPKFDTRIQLEPQQLTFMEFTPEPFESTPGTAHVFNITQTDNGVVTGGLTVVYVITN